MACSIERDLADLVEEQRPFVGEFEDAALLRLGVGEGAFLVAEQFAFEQGFGNCRAVDGDERLGAAHAPVVQRLGDQVLAGAVLAFEQDGRRLARGDAADEAHDLAHRAGLGDHFLRLRRRLLGDVFDARHHPDAAVRVREGRGADHGDALLPVLLVHADDRVADRVSLLQAELDAAVGFAGEAAEDVPAAAADHLLGGPAKEPFGGQIQSRDGQFVVVQEIGFRQVLKERFEHRGPLPFGHQSWTSQFLSLPPRRRPAVVG